MDEANKSIGIVVLAAGAASRMNTPKQMLEFDGKTLLRRAVETAIAVNCSPIVVVLGANFEMIRAEIEDLKATICFNADWQSGLSSSLKIGLKNLLDINPKLDALIVALADQPLVTAHHLQKLIKNFQQSNIPLVAAKYNGTIGVPALFSKEIFADFADISGDKGAKTIIEKYKNSLQTIDLPEAAFDVDTREDYLNLPSPNTRNE